MGGGQSGGRWRCTKQGHSYVVVGLFGFMAEDLELDKPKPMNNCFIKRNGAPPEVFKYPGPGKPWPNETKDLQPPKPGFRVIDPEAACTS
jgi:hypothetical protein